MRILFILLIIGMALLAFIIFESRIESADFVVTKYRVFSNKVKDKNYPIRVIMLSDLHNREYGEDNKRLFEAIERRNPDLIILAGDMITDNVGEANARVLSFIEKLSCRFPVFYGYGNHEDKALRLSREGDFDIQKALCHLEEKGTAVLDNASGEITIRGTIFKLFGLTLPKEAYSRTRKYELSESDINNLVGECSPEDFNILIAHSPYFYETYDRWGADLIFSGHVHGGVVRFGSVGLITPQFDLFYKRSRGMFTDKESGTHIVSGGLGNHRLPFRVFNRPELIVTDIYRK